MAEGCDMCTDLRVRLMALRGEVAATVTFIDREQVEPTMPRRQFVPTIRGRLVNAVDNATGR